MILENRCHDIVFAGIPIVWLYDHKVNDIGIDIMQWKRKGCSQSTRIQNPPLPFHLSSHHVIYKVEFGCMGN